MQFIERNIENSSKITQPILGRGLPPLVLTIYGMGVGVIAAFLISRDAGLFVVALVAFLPLLLFISNRPFTGLLLWLVLMPFVSIFPTSAIIYWVIYRILTPGILILALISRMLKVREHAIVRIGPPELAMGLLILIVPLSALLSNSNSSLALIRYGDQIFLPFCMYLIVRLLAPRDHELHQLQWVALFIVLSQSFIGFLAWVAPQFLPVSLRHLQGERTIGSLMDADLFSAMLIFCAGILIQGAIQHKSTIVRFIFFAASGLCAIFVFLSLERAAWLGGALVLIGLILLFRKVMLRLIFIGLIMMVILGTGVLSTHISLSADRFTDPGPVYDRVVIFDAMYQMIQLKPVLGWGYETLDQNLPHFYRRIGEAMITRGLITSHNTYLTILTELGLVGFILYIFPVFWWLVLSGRVWQRMPKEGLWSRSLLAVLWLSMLFDFTVSNFMDMRWFPIGITHWWMVLGFIANMVYPYQKNRQAAPAAQPSINTVSTMDRTIRVVMLGSYPVDPTRIWGGVQAAYSYLVKGLVQAKDLDVHILTIRPTDFTGPDQVKQDNLTIHLMPPYPRFERMRNYRIYQSAIDKQLAQIQPDLIHVQDIAAEAYVALRSGYPTVMTVHGIRREDNKYFSSWKQRLRNYFDSALIEKYNLEHARNLIAISRYVTAYYNSMLRPDAEVYFIPNAVDERFFNVKKTSNGNDVLFAGRVIPRKRVMDLVRAFALVVSKVPTAQLRIAGEMTSEKAYVDSIRQWIRQANLEEQIHFLGPLPETSILQEFANCRALVLPSAQETAPMAIAQAMAAGKPVVATRIGGVGEMVGEDGSRGLMVDVGNLDQLAEAIILLLQDPDLQGQMGQNGRDFARENYHFENVARRTANIYRHVVMKEQRVNG